MAIPTYGRTRAEFTAPFAGSGQIAGLALASIEIFLGEDHIYEDYEGTAMPARSAGAGRPSCALRPSRRWRRPSKAAEKRGQGDSTIFSRRGSPRGWRQRRGPMPFPLPSFSWRSRETRAEPPPHHCQFRQWRTWGEFEFTNGGNNDASLGSRTRTSDCGDHRSGERRCRPGQSHRQGHGDRRCRHRQDRGERYGRRGRPRQGLSSAGPRSEALPPPAVASHAAPFASRPSSAAAAGLILSLGRGSLILRRPRSCRARLILVGANPRA